MADEEQKSAEQSQVPAEPPAPLLEPLLREQFGEAVLAYIRFRGQRCATIALSALLDVCRWLKAEQGFTYLADVIAVDYPKRDKRFQMVYQLFCVERAERLRLKVDVAEGESVPSVSGIWSGAAWPERECFDLMGIVFSGHPDLRRILLPEEATGHPLRKDYPLRGRERFADEDLGYKVERGGGER